MSTILPSPSDDFEQPQRVNWRDWAALEVAELRRKRERPVEATVGPAAPVSMPIRTVPDSYIDGQPTVNTAVRRIMPVASEIQDAEAQARRLMEDK